MGKGDTGISLDNEAERLFNGSHRCVLDNIEAAKLQLPYEFKHVRPFFWYSPDGEIDLFCMNEKAVLGMEVKSDKNMAALPRVFSQMHRFREYATREYPEKCLSTYYFNINNGLYYFDSLVKI